MPTTIGTWSRTQHLVCHRWNARATGLWPLPRLKFLHSDNVDEYDTDDDDDCVDGPMAVADGALLQALELYDIYAWTRTTTTASLTE